MGGRGEGLRDRMVLRSCFFFFVLCSSFFVLVSSCFFFFILLRSLFFILLRSSSFFREHRWMFSETRERLQTGRIWCGSSSKPQTSQRSSSFRPGRTSRLDQTLRAVENEGNLSLDGGGGKAATTSPHAQQSQQNQQEPSDQTAGAAPQ